MIYQHSFRPEGPYQGEFEHPQRALDAGRAMYGAVHRVYVGQMEDAYFSDFMLPAVELLGYMQERAAEQGDEFSEPFENLPAPAKRRLGEFIRDAIGEFEAELPEELQFTGKIVKKHRVYTESMMVRPADFS